MNRVHWPNLRDLGILGWGDRAIADGRIGHLGFSFHDDFDIFREIVDAYDWPFCQIQYNYMDTEYQAGTRGLQYAAQKGLAVVIMEPLRGGQITRRPPASVAKLWESAGVRRTPAEWGLQWVWSHPEVSVALSGMSAMQELVGNLESADRSAAGLLTGEELALVSQVREEYRKLSPIPCTGCKYCMPCPNGVEIPLILEYYNDAIAYDDAGAPRFRYRQLAKDKRADNCVECFECEEKCPQAIPITEWLKKAHDWLGPKK
jgi:predicted aldo/keto reductase-like oxidoreductase